MAIIYDLYKNPPKANPGNDKFLHARTVVIHTVESEELSEIIQGISTFSTADVKGVLKAVSDRLFACLSNSMNVHLEGIGTFSVSLKCRPVREKDEIRAPSIRFKDINFRPDVRLKKRFQHAKFERNENNSERHYFTSEQRLTQILDYIRREGSISQSIASRLNECSSLKTKDDLKHLVKTEQIRPLTCGKRTIYVIGNSL